MLALASQNEGLPGNIIGSRRTMTAKFLSDTIFLAVHTDEPLGDPNQITSHKDFFYDVCLQMLRAYLAHSMGILVNCSFPFAVRGAISVGPLIVEQDILAGPAIDEAAAIYEKPNGAFIVASPSVLGIYQRAKGYQPDSEDDKNPFLVSYQVPWNDGKARESRVVNPFFGQTDGVEALEKRLLLPFERDINDPRVKEKRDNTQRFYNVAKSIGSKHVSS